MNQQKEAMQLALDALRSLICHDSYETEYDGQMLTICPDCGGQEGMHKESCAFVAASRVVNTLTAALALPDAEPLGYMRPDELRRAVSAPYLCRVHPAKDKHADMVPVYTSPQPAIAPEPVKLPDAQPVAVISQTLNEWFAKHHQYTATANDWNSREAARVVWDAAIGSIAISGLPADAVCTFRDGDAWVRVRGDFLNLQESPADFCATPPQPAIAKPDAKPVATVRAKSDGYGGTFVQWETLPVDGMKLYAALQPVCEATVDIEVWPQYIAGMIECYLEGKPLASGREAGIAAIIQRRMKSIPATPQPAIAPEPVKLTRSEVQAIVIGVCDQIYPQDKVSYSEADSVFYGAFVSAIEAAIYAKRSQQ